jgi:hypothetical protein
MNPDPGQTIAAQYIAWRRRLGWTPAEIIESVEQPDVADPTWDDAHMAVYRAWCGLVRPVELREAA